MANSRAKGNKGERVAANLFTEWTGRKFSKVPRSGGLHWQKANTIGDIVCTVEAFYFPFSVEVKNHKEIKFDHLIMPGIKKPKVFEFWDQCIRDASRGKKIPLLLMRYNGLPKDFFFVVVERELFEFCIEPFRYNENPFLTIENQGYDLVVLTSTQFFSIPYKRVRRVFNNYAKNKEELIVDLPNTNGYKISNRGYIISPKNNIIHGTINTQGIRVTAIPFIDGKKTVSIYRYVGKLFVKNPKNKEYLNHIKPTKSIADARNLEWVTPSENTKHHYDNIVNDYVIKKIEPESGEVKGIYRSPILAAKSVNKESGSSIVKVLGGKRTTAYGFKWIREYR